jgi:hypothetical protein
MYITTVQPLYAIYSKQMDGVETYHDLRNTNLFTVPYPRIEILNPCYTAYPLDGTLKLTSNTNKNKIKNRIKMDLRLEHRELTP